jgi:hypothetical protein
MTLLVDNNSGHEMKLCFQAYIPENVLITLGGKSRQQIKQLKFFAVFFT